MPRRIVVVGAGVSGLTVGHALVARAKRDGRPVELHCLEAGEYAGGCVRTTEERGVLFEWGPTGFLDDAPATLDLVRDLGLAEHLIQAREAAARRYVLRKGRLREVPLTPRAFLTSGVLSPTGKLRVLFEPWIPRFRRKEESVHGFAARRLGLEAAGILADAMVGGVFAGDSRRLSLRSVCPKIAEMEARHGSLFAALRARRRAPGKPAGPAGTLTSFRGGMQELTDALANALGDRLRLRTQVTGISDLGDRGFRVHLRDGPPIEADGVVLACPPGEASGLVAAIDPDLSSAFESIPSAPLAVVHLAYRRAAVGRQPEGFGFLVPRGAGPRILGALWPSQIFDGRAPDDVLTTTAMVGGACDPHAPGLSDTELTAIVREDLRTAHEMILDHFRRPGSCFAGEERLAIAAEARLAPGCGFCRERKAALSPENATGEHRA